MSRTRREQPGDESPHVHQLSPARVPSVLTSANYEPSVVTLTMPDGTGRVKPSKKGLLYIVEPADLLLLPITLWTPGALSAFNLWGAVCAWVYLSRALFH